MDTKEAEGRWLLRLFEAWPSVVVEETRLGAEPVDILPEEAEQVVTAVPRRRIEFAAGRWCARRALARLSIEGFALRNGADRAPRWPRGVVGSITHTGLVPGGFCGVAVARAADYSTVGLDAECPEISDPSVQLRILTRAETRLLARLAAAQQASLTSVIFSAKECFYKAQYPLSGHFLRFEDVEIELDAPRGIFEARLSKRAPAGLPLTRCRGRYLTAEDFVLTGVAIAVGETEIEGRG